MDEKAPTVDRSLDILSEAVGKAADDFRAVRTVLDRARADIASHNTSVSRTAVAAAERVVDHLRKADDALKEVLVAIEERD